jgi:hypothetical protein
MSNDLILQFQKDPSNKQLEQELLNQHKNYIQSHINKWKGVLPDPVMDAYGKKYAIDAFKTYKDIEGVGMFSFSKDDIVRHPLISKLLERYDDIK